jgi:hypothetical protein
VKGLARLLSCETKDEGGQKNGSEPCRAPARGQARHWCQKNGGAKDPLKTIHKAAISFAVFEEAEEIENLGRGPEAHDPAALPNGDGRYPDWNEPILAVGQSELGMAEHLKEELSISPCVKRLVGRESAERESAKNKGASVKGEHLPSLVALFSNQVDSLKLPEAVFGNTDLGKERTDPCETGITGSPMLEFSHNSAVTGKIKRRFGGWNRCRARTWQSWSHTAPSPHAGSWNVAEP